MTSTLYWLTRDLRLDDNAALIRAINSDRLLCVYCVDPQWFRPQRLQVSSMGRQRWSFIRQNLQTLKKTLQTLQQDLCIEYAEAAPALARLIEKHKINRLVCSRQFSHYGRAVLESLQLQAPQLQIEQIDSSTLFKADEMSAISIRELPERIALLPVSTPIQAPASLPPPPLRLVSTESQPAWLPAGIQKSPFEASEDAARQALQELLTKETASTGEERLDLLSPIDALSAWLSQGVVSPRRLAQMLRSHRTQADEALTAQLLTFLLHREAMQWQAFKAGERLFDHRGLAGKGSNCCFYPERYQKWCHGTTPFPLVNACMRQLKNTGCLSQFGRRIVASCFIHELDLDWRYGAAWFEHQLIDHDEGINWGEWQSMAGVAVDKVPATRIDLESLSSTADPDGNYRQQWAPEPVHGALDSLDAADWPIEP